MNLRALLISLGIALAASAGQQPEEQCDGTTYDQSVCLSGIYKQVDAELNGAYQKALAVATQYGPGDVRNLRDSERKWIAWRDSDCAAEYGFWGGGSGGPNARALCLIVLTREHAAHLNAAHKRLGADPAQGKCGYQPRRCRQMHISFAPRGRDPVPVPHDQAGNIVGLRKEASVFDQVCYGAEATARVCQS